MACRSQMAEIWCLRTDLVCQLQVQFYACFMGDGRQMEHTVGAASQCHIHSQCIQKCLFGHDVSRADIFFKKLHNFHSCMLRELDSL